MPKLSKMSILRKTLSHKSKMKLWRMRRKKSFKIRQALRSSKNLSSLLKKTKKKAYLKFLKLIII